MKTLPYVVAIVLVAFAVGFFIRPNSDKTLRNELKEQRNKHEEIIHSYQKIIEGQQLRYTVVKQRMKLDSIKFVGEIKLKEEQYSKLKSRYEKINFRNYTNFQLDSVVNRLYPD